MGWFSKKKKVIDPTIRVGIEAWLRQGVAKFAGIPNLKVKFEHALKQFLKGDHEEAEIAIQLALRAFDKIRANMTLEQIAEETVLKTWLTELQK